MGFARGYCWAVPPGLLKSGGGEPLEMTGKMPVLLNLYRTSRYLYDSVIRHHHSRVFAGGVGPTGRGANMHLETESPRHTPRCPDG